MDADLADDIYEAAFFPDRWADVLDRLAVIAGARGGVLFTAHPAVGVLNHRSSAAIRADVDRYANEGWLFRGSRLARITASRVAGFVVEDDLYDAAAIAADPTYRDFLRPRGLGWAAGTIVALPTGDVVVISLERDHSRGPVEPAAVARLDALRPHLARSTLVAARLQLARAEAAAAALDLIGLPALVLDRNGRIVVASARAEQITGLVHWRANDHVGLSDPVADSQLRVALAGLTAGNGDVRSFVVRGEFDRPAAVAHVLPVRRDALDLFAGAAAILVITSVIAPAAPPAELIQSLFDLTAAEARVARSLAGGSRIDEIAADAGVSRNTIRTQLQAILDKTGSRRQQDVVSLLGGIGTTRI